MPNAGSPGRSERYGHAVKQRAHGNYSGPQDWENTTSRSVSFCYPSGSTAATTPRPLESAFTGWTSLDRDMLLSPRLTAPQRW